MTGRAARFPKQIYAVGDEPDPRFSMANERTFLAWIRTALALFAAGVALEALNVPMHAGWRLAAAITLAGCGVLAAAQAWLGWARTERAMRTKAVLPSPSASVVITIGVILAVILVSVGLWQR